MRINPVTMYAGKFDVVKRNDREKLACPSKVEFGSHFSLSAILASVGTYVELDTRYGI